ncbi:hypothetical protein EYF80_018727 [Liparis tanakae]|uniref:Uncharacterized protein n=1 Tax=Liparis tanakae TaxID=230148 RepID=A0A4Z2HZ45_9TELE|nr:hypothetical protein EYF80_018727 [Liparis tanakae]
MNPESREDSGVNRYNILYAVLKESGSGQPIGQGVGTKQTSRHTRSGEPRLCSSGGVKPPSRSRPEDIVQKSQYICGRTICSGTSSPGKPIPTWLSTHIPFDLSDT